MQLSSRQVHLDFHTSGEIPGIAANFDANVFAKTFREAHVNSVTVFGRCHHGYLYYPSKVFPELIHPHLENKNLLFDQIDALHAEGIRAPVYTAIQWEYYTAVHRPEWLIRNRDGSHYGGPFIEPGFRQALCVNTGYRDFLKTHTIEMIELLGDKLDGFFFDIVGIRPCYCSVCRELMKKRGVDISEDKAVLSFAVETMNHFKERMTALVRKYSKECTIFYNAGHIGPCTAASAKCYTHFELESLPSGDDWGYLHFPVTARYARTLGNDCMGMTGKFHTWWGDFHSLKNLAALEFECFRMLSYGFAATIGDQLEPCGTLNAATYKLIGNVYSRIALCEEWARPSKAIVEAALVTSELIDTEHQIPDTIMGAVQMLEELALQFDIVTPDANLSNYKLIILPDDLILNFELQQRLDAYVSAGGAVIACHRGGSDTNGVYPKCFGAIFNGLNDNYPDFIIADGILADELELGNEYVIYQQGIMVEPTDALVIMEARAPYFPRKGDHFCSHQYTPSAKGNPYPAALQNGRVILFSHPLFGQYRDCAPRWCKQLINNAVNVLLPDRLVRHNGPSTMTVSLLDQPEHERVTVHLLSYVPVRKSATIDIIEERTKLRDIRLELCIPGKTIKSARLVPDDIPLVPDGNTVTVPEVDGYAIVELK